MSALLRMLKPLDASSYGTTDRKRRLIANLCRMIGQEVQGRTNGTPAPASDAAAAMPSADSSTGHHRARADGHVSGHSRGQADAAAIDPPVAANGNGDALSPRLRQTLASLLAGESEKQVARRLALSPHTVHVYVKKLYKLYNVSSRGELLAKWVQPK